MAAPDYSRRTFSLVAVHDRTPIIDQGTLINGVTVLSVPAGAGAQLHFGSGRDPIDVVAGDSWEVSSIGPDGCPIPLDEGLYLTNPAGAGDLQLLISFGPIGAGARTVA
jgi:hypothetical protein